MCGAAVCFSKRNPTTAPGIRELAGCYQASGGELIDPDVRIGCWLFSQTAFNLHEANICLAFRILNKCLKVKLLLKYLNELMSEYFNEAYLSGYSRSFATSFA